MGSVIKSGEFIKADNQFGQIWHALKTLQFVQSISMKIENFDVGEGRHFGNFHESIIGHCDVSVEMKYSPTR